jgi:PhnB protein
LADVKPIPDNFPQVAPYLSVDGAQAAIEFYAHVFGAKERYRLPAPDDKIGHAELEIGNSVVMLADEFPEMGSLSPTTVGGSPVTLNVYVEDVDAVFEQATKAGAEVLSPVQNQFYGDRSGAFKDPFGHKWNVATHIEDVPPEEMQKRMEEMGNG